MNPKISELQNSISDLVERAASARQEAEYFRDLGLLESAKMREQEAQKYEDQAASATAELSGMQ